MLQVTCLLTCHVTIVLSRTLQLMDARDKAAPLWPPPFVSLRTRRGPVHIPHIPVTWLWSLGLVSGSVLAAGPVLGQLISG